MVIPYCTEISLRTSFASKAANNEGVGAPSLGGVPPLTPKKSAKVFQAGIKAWVKLLPSPIPSSYSISKMYSLWCSFKV